MAARTGGPTTLPQEALEDEIDFWDVEGRVTPELLRTHIEGTQRLLEITLLEPYWDDPQAGLDDRPFALHHQDDDVVVLRDTGGGWRSIFRRLGVVDETVRKLLRVVHRRVWTALADDADEGVDVVVLDRPAWMNASRRVEW